MSPENLVSPNGLETTFWIFALAGTFFFLIRVAIQFLGMADHGDVVDASGHDMVGGSGHGSYSDVLFKMISLNSLTAFFMMLGWTGLTCYKQFALGASLSVVIALIVATFCMFFTGMVFDASKRLVSRGSDFSLAKSVGMKATVYQQIPAQGRGRIEINVPGSLMREVDAVSENAQEIESFKTVEIVKVIDDNTVVVKKISN